MNEQRYVYDAAWEQERARLAGIEALWDAGSRALLTELGVGPHARVLEAGAGGGALGEWMAAQVGPHGRVLATDIDTRFVEPLAGRPGGRRAARHHVRAAVRRTASTSRMPAS